MLPFQQLDERPELQRFDPAGMHKIYDKWPEIARQAYDTAEIVDFEGTSHIVFAGMGGSGTVGDLLASVLSRTGIHATVVKGYLLPKTVNPDTLVVCTSVSGNTSETISVAEAAKKTGCKMVCFSSGGRLEQFCSTHHIQFKKVQMLLNPRTSFPSYAYAMIKTLKPILPLTDSDISESLKTISGLQNTISSANLSDANPSLDMARWMRSIPLIYYPWGLEAAAIRFKNSIQENMKMHAMTEDVIEASHNGIVSWESTSQVMPILITGQDDYTRTKDRWQILKEFFASRDIDYREVRSTSGSILSKIIGLMYQLDYATIYGAVLRGTDPSPVAAIDFVKQRTEQAASPHHDSVSGT